MQKMTATRPKTWTSLLFSLALLAGLWGGPTGLAADGPYRDVGTGDFHAPAIEALDAIGLFIDTECAEDLFCPDEPIPRWVMAVWLGRAAYGIHSGQDSPSRFTDLSDEMAWAAPYIEILVEEGAVEECGTDPLRFCPEKNITRAETATALTRAFGLPPAGHIGFGDLGDVDNIGDIRSLAAARATNGCSSHPLLFCPSGPVTRGQMAAFLGRITGLVDLPGYQPTVDPTPLPTDPAVRVGTLENGLTYYLRQNDQPGKSVTLRLAVKAGSINEPEQGRGIAHFLEHILFEGTEAYTAESLSLTIRSLGAELGPDLNASVWYDQTVYELTVSADPLENVSTALHVLSQMAHAALIEPEAVVAERGVVLDEMRLRTATGSGRISAEFDRIYTRGTPYEGYHPIGTIPSLEAMTAQDLREYYETWYVPSNMAVVAVGDVPADDLYALVEEHFGPIEPGAAPTFSFPRGVPDPAASHYVLTNKEQGFSYISLDIPIPTFDYGTVGGDRLLMLESLIGLMVQNRLDDAFYRGELAQVDSPRFITFNHNRNLRYFGTNWQGENLDTASTDYLSVLQTVQRYGFNEDDLTRATRAFAASLRHELETSGSVGDREHAGSYVAHYLYGEDLSDPRQRHDRLSALLEEVTVEELTDHYRWLMSRAGPILIAVGPDADSVPTAAALEAAVDQATPRSEPPPIEPEIDRLMEVPDPVAPVATREIGVLDGVEWEFANGAKVVFAHSDIAESTVDLRARSLGGWSALFPGAWALAPRATEAVLRSGFGDLTKLQIDRFLGERTVSLSALIGETTEGFEGAAGQEDLETLFQLMHMLTTAPRVDDLAFLQARNSAAIRTSLAEVNPAWQAWVAYNHARFGSDWHHPVATREQVAAMTPESLLSLYQSRLGGVDDLVVAVVGDTSAEEVERLARLYIGTLPAKESDTYIDRHAPFPTDTVRRHIPIDESMSAVLQMYHETEQSMTPSARVNARLLEAILDHRLVQLVREQLGASYVASVSISPTPAPRPTMRSDIVVTSDPARFDDVYRRVLSVLAELVANGPTPEEFREARAVARADYEKTDNGDLLRSLAFRLYLEDDQLLLPGRGLEELDRATASTVRTLAASLYDTQARVEIIRRPPGASE